MDERTGSKRAFVLAWLLTVGFVLLVGPFGSRAETEECGSDAACAPTKLQSQAGGDAYRSDWRGKEPQICLAKSCDERPPVFCYATREPSSAMNGWTSRHDDLCDREPRFRTARTRA